MNKPDAVALTPADALPAFAALTAEAGPEPDPLRQALRAACRRDERHAVQDLLAEASLDSDVASQAQALATGLVQNVRSRRARASGVDALMHEFSLSSQEGIALMCLAEALLRIPDPETADRLIAEKISLGDWQRHLGGSPSLFVNAATWALVVTGKLVAPQDASHHGLGTALGRLIARGGEPLIRRGVDLAMRMLGRQFVTGQTIDEALAHGRANEARGYRYSFDMLGEAALTMDDADAYYRLYEEAIHAIGRASAGRGIRQGPGISVKLSALHPRYSVAQRERVMAELLPRLKELVMLARRYDIGINIDAEEADRLELSLDLLEALAVDADTAGFDGIGFVVQAYQKRCPALIDCIVDLARRAGRRLMVRLVKGAYWDAEIKRAQVDGMPDYPVYTRKAHTDLCYLVCAQRLLAASDVIYPQFATHNALTLATVHAHAQRLGVTDYEFQCLHGMGETLYDQVVGKDGLGHACRIYAPVGSHQTLLAYLVRRLLENGANTSFVNQIVDEQIPLERLLADPVQAAAQSGGAPHPAIPLPAALYGPGRRNSTGMDFNDRNVLREIAPALQALGQRFWHAAPLLAQPGPAAGDVGLPVTNPADRSDQVGLVHDTSGEQREAALAAATEEAPRWQAMTPAARAALLLRAADLLERERLPLMSLAVREAGKSLPNALAEVREAVDFLRYYAAQASQAPAAPALGPVLCISPWNFPLAIFIGQVSAALAAGNVVLAKPAEQTPLIAHLAATLLHQAGIPRAALQLLPGPGDTVGAALVADARIRGVLFTGSTEVAALINRQLAARGVAQGCALPLIAETGGQNAMVVDSSALPEQVVQDVLASAFDSAGQRCSALRVLCLQEDVADHVLGMLRGALRELRIGVPDRLATDIGPVIDEDARRALMDYIDRAGNHVLEIIQLPLPDACRRGSFVAPTVIVIDDLSRLRHEVFGPVLHVLRYRRDQLPQLLAQINASGYGLTLGIHSRIDETVESIVDRAHVGNIYVNRNMVGAVVGVQPFGGEGKSGTGPKAGGPLYLRRLQHAADSGIAAADLGVEPPAKDAGLQALQDWARANDDAVLIALTQRYAQNSLLGRALRLPGPTGESNILRFAARGAVLCAASDRAALINQLAAVLATGNQALMSAAAYALLPAGLPQAVSARIVIVADVTGHPAISMALCDQACCAALLPVLAAREGALTSVAQTQGSEPIPLWRLVAERTVSVNTTAAGGNASLMTLEPA
ncbi:bifunctional proline dehydrogenase/L-glutamate gamma-semialdehyde dehydrogenase PutA [Noviherbaspirillum sp. 1P10PC]|uniref:bifunctional proline dehydrogenase/L-glutamate gamma-semialdehyde dehydrogenase PutA n=1 Tax=Noviherbaspirillum sp. 1P10PC TaxID=3132292 RepID=UPI00399FF4F5